MIVTVRSHPLLRFLMVMVVAASLAVAPMMATPAPSGAQAPPAHIVVFLGGVNSTSDDGSFDSIQTALEADGAAGGWANPDITSYYRYSYAYPSPGYGCADSWTGSIADMAGRLALQLADLAQAKPGSEIALIGHSQGGLVALAYLALLKDGQDGDWRSIAPNSNARLSHVVTLSAPLGGIPPAFASLTDIAVQVAVDSGCEERVTAPQNTENMRAIYTSSGADHPRGGMASVAHVVNPQVFPPQNGRYTNQDLANAASFASIGILTIGNLTDWVWQPCGPFQLGILSNMDTQWMIDQPDVRVYGRAVNPPEASGCTSVLDVGLNHAATLTDPTVQAAVASFLDGEPPDQLQPAPAR